MDTKKLNKLLVYINPIFFYYTFIYCVVKFYQVITGSESIWQRFWNKYMDTFGDSEAVHIIFVLNLYTTILFWIICIVLQSMQRLKIPKSFENFKIQAKDSETEKSKEFFNHVIRVNLKNQLVTFVLAIFHHIFLGNFLGIKISRDLPSFPIVLRDLLILALFEDIFFYYSHRLLHHRLFYHLHKQHHEFITPSCLTAQYAGTFEHILSNVIPVVSGFVITGSHMSVALLHVTVVFMTITNDHSGYHLPFLHSSELHDYHHLKFNINYGIYGLMDLLHGTYGHFKTSKKFENHRTLWSLTPTEK